MTDWMLHHSQQELYRSPFGAAACGEEVTLRLKVNSQVTPEKVVVRYWQEILGAHEGQGGSQQEAIMEPVTGLSKHRMYQVKLRLPRTTGLVWYLFKVELSGKTFFYGNNQKGLGGVGQIATSLPPAYQITVHDPKLTTPSWFKDGVIYQIFVDRFFNGCEDGRVLHPKPNSLLHAHWDSIPIYIRDIRHGEVIRWDFFGGNLLGVLKKLSYLKELGVSILYLNPIFEAPSNHKYDTADYFKIDPMFGDNEIFHSLCQVAQELGIAVILDGVFSHTGSDSIYFNKEGNYPQLGAYQSTESPYYSWYRFSQHPEHYESWWGIDTLPNVNELNSSYQNFIYQGENSVVKYWMGQGTKGWRLDVVDELPGAFVKGIRQVMKKADPDSILIGEVWEDASNKESYGERRQYLLGYELDSVMNYPFRKSLLDFALGVQDAAEVHQVLMSLYENYPLHHFYSAMNLIGSHDVPRTLTLLGEAPDGDTLTVKEMSTFKLSQEQRRLAVTRLKLLTLWQMTFPGVPSIYYGDEAGTEGHGDPLCRKPFPWGQEDQELLNWHKLLIGLRNKLAVLRTGQWIPLVAEGDVYGYLRCIENGH
ncbi:MAG: glycoside hydrolase family 13 protein, partial [Bacillota bacterium]|nr:glycoside hydrolase family 13 protein [Bacillota bacterium]